MHGEGTFIYGDGRKYEGSFANDKKEGHGVLTWTDGRVFDGGWQNGL